MKVKISDQSINTNKDNRSTQVTTRRNRILSSQKMIGKDMVKRQSKGTSRKYAWG